MPGDRRGRVAGRVELEVLRVVAWLLVLGVELGHAGGRVWVFWSCGGWKGGG